MAKVGVALWEGRTGNEEEPSITGTSGAGRDPAGAAAGAAPAADLSAGADGMVSFTSVVALYIL